MKPWCVMWLTPSGSTGWCATFRDSKPSEDALHDKTACGMVVTLRVGSAKRAPTCDECKRRVARRRERL